MIAIDSRVTVEGLHAFGDGFFFLYSIQRALSYDSQISNSTSQIDRKFCLAPY